MEVSYRREKRLQYFRGSTSGQGTSKYRLETFKTMLFCHGGRAETFAASSTGRGIASSRPQQSNTWSALSPLRSTDSTPHGVSPGAEPFWLRPLSLPRTQN